MTGDGGAGTRNASQGAASTRRALSTIANAPTCASHPAIDAMPSMAFAQTATRPATWTRAIAGTATRFSTRPASVIRENVAAITGSRAISTAADAAIDATSHDSHRGRVSPWFITPSSAAVAPNVSTKPALLTSSGAMTTSRPPATAILPRGAAMIEEARSQVDGRDQRRAPHRGPCGNDLRVREQQDQRRERGTAAGQADRRERDEHQRREDRDVTARDGDDVIGARGLQPQADVVRQAAAVPDEHRGHDCR